MIKILSPALRHPENRTLADFHRYWAESHGPLFSQTAALRRYVQHLTLPEAYGRIPNPTYDGISMFWFDDVDAMTITDSSPAREQALRAAVIEDDRQLFDRIPEWPTAHKRASITATEVVIIEGETTPEMVKLIVVVARRPGLSHREFFEHWQGPYGERLHSVPGVRRYVQNHAVLSTFQSGRMTHDGWTELWFDDLEALHAAVRTTEWREAQEDVYTFIAEPIGIGVAREIVQKEFDVPLPEPQALSMSEDEIRARLKEQGYRSLAADPVAPARIKGAAQAGMLAVWTHEHLVTIDDSHIDARPER